MPRYIAAVEDLDALGRDRSRHYDSVPDAVRAALSQPCAVLVMPARDDTHSLVITIRSTQAHQVPSAQERQSEEPTPGRRVAYYEATGLLGLEDVAVYDDESAKPWWKRLFGGK